MTKDYKRTLFAIAFGVSLYAALTHLGSVLGFLRHVGNLLLPIAIGLVLAFVLTVPANGFEKLLGRIFAKAKRQPQKKTLHLVSLLLTLLCAAVVIALVATLVIPELVRTAKSAVSLLQAQWPRWIAFLESYGIDTTSIKDWLSTLELNTLLEKAADNVGIVLGSISSAATSTVSGAVSIFFGIVIAIYGILSRDSLAVKSKKLLYANLRGATADRVCYVATLLRDTYARFLSSQCVESLILGSFMLLAFLVFKLPYAGLVAIVTAVSAMIPYIGALVSCSLAVLLALLVSPGQALLCFIVYQIVQFIENQFIYPHVVGSSVGLSPLLTLAAVIIGGNLFGLIGMIFFIPLTAVIYELVRENTDKKLADKKIDTL